MLHGLNTGD